MAGDADANQVLMRLKLLPPCPGPKLHAFKHQHAPIQWHEQLDHSEDSLANDGHVFKVTIKGHDYALKVFNFSHPCTAREFLGPIEGATISNELLAFHSDPFFAECRAYARIEELDAPYAVRRSDRRYRNDQKKYRTRYPTGHQVAARCFGFLALDSTEFEPYLEARGIDLWNDIDPDDDYRLEAAGSPIRTLVKELIIQPESADCWNAVSVHDYRQMLRSVKSLNRKAQIVHRRIDETAFHRGTGLFVSFSSSWTLNPHCVVDVTAKHISEVWTSADLVMFDGIVEEAGVTNKVRALSDIGFIQKLRSRGKGGS